MHSDGSLEIDNNIPLIDKLMLTPVKMSHQYGLGRTELYKEGKLINGNTEKK